jgi:ankyrin repeat protein
LKVAKVLLDSGCDPNVCDKYGKTPLHVLAQEYYAQGTPDNISILHLLLKSMQHSTHLILCAQGFNESDMATKDMIFFFCFRSQM